MSRKRYISTDLSTDLKLADLAEHGPLPLLLYTWAIPHMDDWGRMSGEARQFKLTVCPALDVSTKEVDDAIEKIARAGLWQRYEVDGKRYISIPEGNWFKHQSYINKSKRGDDSGSSFPTPPDNTEEHRTTPQITEEQQEPPQMSASFSFSPSPSFSPYKTSSSGIARNPYSLFEKQEFGRLDEYTSELIMKLIDDYTENWVMRAMLEAVRQGEKSLAYVGGILKRWKALNSDKPWDEEKQNPKGQQRQYGRGQPNKPKLAIINIPATPAVVTDDRLQAIREKAQQRDARRNSGAAIQ